jgi:hypothetical protein
VNEDKSRVRKDPAGLESGVALNNSRVTAAVKSGHLTMHEGQHDVMGLELTGRQILLGFQVTQRLRYRECYG